VTEEGKMLWMFKEIHGEITGACYVEVHEDENTQELTVHLMKHGNSCWFSNKTDLLFDFITKNIG